MKSGRVELEAPTAARLLTGDAGMTARIFFVDQQTGARTRASLGLVAYRCEACEALVLKGEGVDDSLSCFECGNPIGADESACSACGWSW